MNAQSLLSARQDFYGSYEPWYSYKPPEYAFLKDQSPYDQVAGQVFFTNRAISDQLEKIPDKNWLEIEYETLCSSPTKIYSDLLKKLTKLGYEVQGSYQGPRSFAESNQIKLDENEVSKITHALKQYQRTSI
jgi:hypothetical protein